MRTGFFSRKSRKTRERREEERTSKELEGSLDILWERLAVALLQKLFRQPWTPFPQIFLRVLTASFRGIAREKKLMIDPFRCAQDDRGYKPLPQNIITPLNCSSSRLRGFAREKQTCIPPASSRPQ
jgi:hypothetical protein